MKLSVAVIILLTLTGSCACYAGEQVNKNMTTNSQAPAMSNDVAMDFIKKDMNKMFTSAANPKTHLLTKQEAIAAGWGWAADHFDEMDRRHTGAIEFSDLLEFLKAQKVK